MKSMSFIHKQLFKEVLLSKTQIDKFLEDNKLEMINIENIKFKENHVVPIELINHYCEMLGETYSIFEKNVKSVMSEAFINLSKGKEKDIIFLNSIRIKRGLNKLPTFYKRNKSNNDLGDIEDMQGWHEVSDKECYKLRLFNIKLGVNINHRYFPIKGDDYFYEEDYRLEAYNLIGLMSNIVLQDIFMVKDNDPLYIEKPDLFFGFCKANGIRVESLKENHGNEFNDVASVFTYLYIRRNIDLDRKDYLILTNNFESHLNRLLNDNLEFVYRKINEYLFVNVYSRENHKKVNFIFFVKKNKDILDFWFKKLDYSDKKRLNFNKIIYLVFTHLNVDVDDYITLNKIDDDFFSLESRIVKNATDNIGEKYQFQNKVIMNKLFRFNRQIFSTFICNMNDYPEHSKLLWKMVLYWIDLIGSDYRFIDNDVLVLLIESLARNLNILKDVPDEKLSGVMNFLYEELCSQAYDISYKSKLDYYITYFGGYCFTLNDDGSVTKTNIKTVDNIVNENTFNLTMNSIHKDSVEWYRLKKIYQLNTIENNSEEYKKIKYEWLPDLQFKYGKYLFTLITNKYDLMKSHAELGIDHEDYQEVIENKKYIVFSITWGKDPKNLEKKALAYFGSMRGKYTEGEINVSFIKTINDETNFELVHLGKRVISDLKKIKL